MFDFHSKVTGVVRLERRFVHLLALIALTAVNSAIGFGCGSSKSNSSPPPPAGASAPTDATPPRPPTDEEKLSGRWRKNDCKMIEAGAYKTYYMASILQFTPTTSSIVPTVYLDKSCKKPAIQFQSISSTAIQVVSNIPDHPELIGLNVTPAENAAVKYMSVIIKDGTLRMSTAKRDNDGSTPERRLIPTATDPLYVRELLPPGSTVDGLANVSIKTTYQSECAVLKNETEGSERCTLQFDQAGNKFNFFRLGFVDANCTEPLTSSNYQLESIEYQSLKLSNTDDGIFGFSTDKTGYIVQFHIIRGVIHLEGVYDGSETLTLTEVGNVADFP